MYPARATPFRTLITLGRVASLPTVWSNCLAGWWLGGGGNLWKLPLLLLGVSALYTAGAFLNDAFDADFDRQRRTERPVPAGKIPSASVWKIGFGLLATGVLLLLFCGLAAGFASVFLVLTILIYNFSHKFFTAAPWLMGACRFWIYVIAGATGSNGLNSEVIFCGAALAAYAAGADYLARRKVRRNTTAFGPPLLLLAAPVVMALMLNTDDFRRDALLISTVLCLWLARCLRTVFFGGEISPRWIAANLLAGIALVDWLAVAPVFLPHWQSALLFLALFGLTKWFQKFIPTT
jgi:4-hydroxybenzoate polyprenyltransferase